MVVAISAILGIIAGFVLGMGLNSQVREDIAALHRLCQRIEGLVYPRSSRDASKL